MNKYLKWTGIGLGGLIVLVVGAGLVLYSIGMQKINQVYHNITVESIDVPGDAESIARGQHVATIWACAKCHGANFSGAQYTNDLIDGSIPLFGKITAANLTSGQGGIGQSYTDADWVRAIRHGVKSNHSAEVFMFDYSTLSDQDLGDLIAYLKQLPPIDNDRSEMNYGPIYPIASAVGLFAPVAGQIDHNKPQASQVTADATKEYGHYLSAICTACHGVSIGRTVRGWSQEAFIRAFRTGSIGEAMSSAMFRELTDTELTALWLYFSAQP